MPELAGRTLLYAILMAVTVGIAALIRKWRSAGDVRGLPDARRRASLMAMLQEMRASGANVESCLRALQGRGLRRGVAQGLLIDLERQQPADIDDPREAMWNGYTFAYPGNWKLSPLVPEAGIDAGIAVECIGSGLLMLVREEAASAAYAALLAEQESQIADPQRGTLHTWGALPGRGTSLDGPHRRLKLLVHIEVFKPRDVPTPFTLVQFHAHEEEAFVLPGLRLVQDSFRLPTAAEP